MSFSIHVGPISQNPETTIDLVFGKNVSIDRVIDSASQSAHDKERCGIVSNDEANEMVERTKECLRSIQFE